MPKKDKKRSGANIATGPAPLGREAGGQDALAALQAVPKGAN